VSGEGGKNERGDSREVGDGVAVAFDNLYKRCVHILCSTTSHTVSDGEMRTCLSVMDGKHVSLWFDRSTDGWGQSPLRESGEALRCCCCLDQESHDF